MSFFSVVASATKRAAQVVGFVTDNLVNRYNFSDTNTYPGTGNTAYDLTANNNDLSITGASFTDGYYFDFDGSNDKMQVGSVTSDLQFQGTDTFSIGLWLFNKSTATSPSYMYLCAQQNFGDYDGYSIINGLPGSRNTFRFWFRKDANNHMRTVANTTFSTDTWYYITATYDGSQSPSGIKLYVNGAEVSTTIEVNVGTVTSVNYSSNTFGLGSRNVTLYALCGIGDAHIYNDVLTASEVLANYNATKSTYGL